MDKSKQNSQERSQKPEELHFKSTSLAWVYRHRPLEQQPAEEDYSRKPSCGSGARGILSKKASQRRRYH